MLKNLKLLTQQVNQLYLMGKHMIQDLSQYAVYTGGLVALTSLYYFSSFRKPSIDYWLDLPYLGEYLVKHPDCETNDPDNAKCCHCHSDTVVFQPLVSDEDRRYQHFCGTCENTLFRSRPLV